MSTRQPWEAKWAAYALFDSPGRPGPRMTPVVMYAEVSIITLAMWFWHPCHAH